MQWTTGITTLLLLASAAEAAPGELRAVPAELELGRQAAGAAVDAEVWLVNTGDTSLALTKAKGKCGCITVVDFAAGELAASGAQRVRLSVKAPKEVGERKDTSVVFAVDGGGVVSVPVRMTAVDAADAADADSAATPVAAGPLVAVAEQSDFSFRPGETGKSTVWLVNTGPTPVEVESGKGDCGCLSIERFAPFTLAAGTARPVAFELRAAKNPTPPKAKRLRFLAAGQAPAEVAVRVSTQEPVGSAAR